MFDMCQGVSFCDSDQNVCDKNLRCPQSHDKISVASDPYDPSALMNGLLYPIMGSMKQLGGLMKISPPQI